MTNYPQIGDRVTGEYFGTPFTGRVTSKRWHDVTGDVMYYVALDTPMGNDLMGKPRSSVLVKLHEEGGERHGSFIRVDELAVTAR